MIIDGSEVAERYTEHGIRNTLSGEVMDCDSFNEAEWQSYLYPNAEVVSREIYVTQWVKHGDTSKPDGL
jgi:hypothetical protein